MKDPPFLSIFVQQIVPACFEKGLYEEAVQVLRLHVPKNETRGKCFEHFGCNSAKCSLLQWRYFHRSNVDLI